MRLIRWAGENISPSDDGRLYEKIFEDGLYNEVTIAAAGGAAINIGPLYGVICGREFTSDAMTINATLPSSGTKYGVIYVECDTAQDEPLSVKTTLATDWEPTRQDINVSGTVAQVKIGEYTATATGVTSAHDDSNTEYYYEFGESIGKVTSDLRHYVGQMEYEITTDIYRPLQNVRDVLFGESGSQHLLLRKYYSADYSVAANSSLVLTGTDFGVTAITGYVAVAVYYFTTGNNNVLIRGLSPTGTGTATVMVLRNVSNSTQTGTAGFRVTYANSSVVDSL